VEVEVVTDQIKVEEVVAIKETKGMLEVDMGNIMPIVPQKCRETK